MLAVISAIGLPLAIVLCALVALSALADGMGR